MYLFVTVFADREQVALSLVTHPTIGQVVDLRCRRATILQSAITFDGVPALELCSFEAPGPLLLPSVGAEVGAVVFPPLVLADDSIK
jgi:hypothetical protein